MIYTAFTTRDLTVSPALTVLNNNKFLHRDFPRRNVTEWMKKGLSETASGYGRRLNTGRMVFFEGRWRRIYCCQYSNSGTNYFFYKGKWVVI